MRPEARGQGGSRRLDAFRDAYRNSVVSIGQGSLDAWGSRNSDADLRVRRLSFIDEGIILTHNNGN